MNPHPASSPRTAFVLIALLALSILGLPAWGAPAEAADSPSAEEMIEAWGRDLLQAWTTFQTAVLEAVNGTEETPGAGSTGAGGPTPPAPVAVPPSDEPVQGVGPGMVPIG